MNYIKGVLKKMDLVRFKGLIITLTIIASLSLFTLYSKTYVYQEEILRLSREFISLEDKMKSKGNNWTNYLEKRVNGLAQRQDEYQYSTSERIRILEERVGRQSSVNSNKNVNINNVNIPKQ